MNDVTDIRSLVGPTDPLKRAPADPTTDVAQARAALARVLRVPRQVAERRLVSSVPGRDRWPRLVQASAAAVALLVTGAVVVGAVVVGPGGRGSPAVAATPPVLPYAPGAGTPAAGRLQRIAAAAAALPSEPVTGEFRYVRTEGWALNSAIGGGDVTSVLASSQTEAWRLPDGSGRSRTTTGESLVDRIGSTETLDAVLREPALREEDLTVEAGYSPQPLPDLDRLPYGDATAFAMAVNRNTNDEIPAGAHLAEAIKQLFAEQPVSPSARAKVWQLLATIPGVADRGQLTDRVGRTGMAITLDDDGTAHGLPEQYLLIIDPATGQLLEHDTVLTTDPGALNVRVPAILGLTVYLDAGYTDDTRSRPGQ